MPLKSQITILKFQIISKFQISMTKTVASRIGCRRAILTVLSAEGGSIIGICPSTWLRVVSLSNHWYLEFGAWNFHDSIRTANILIPENCRFICFLTSVICPPSSDLCHLTSDLCPPSSDLCPEYHHPPMIHIYPADRTKDIGNHIPEAAVSIGNERLMNFIADTIEGSGNHT
jgi:hypothetical protein